MVRFSGCCVCLHRFGFCVWYGPLYSLLSVYLIINIVRLTLAVPLSVWRFEMKRRGPDPQFRVVCNNDVSHLAGLRKRAGAADDMASELPAVDGPLFM